MSNLITKNTNVEWFKRLMARKDTLFVENMCVDMLYKLITEPDDEARAKFEIFHAVAYVERKKRHEAHDAMFA